MSQKSLVHYLNVLTTVWIGFCRVLQTSIETFTLNQPTFKVILDYLCANLRVMQYLTELNARKDIRVKSLYHLNDKFSDEVNCFRVNNKSFVAIYWSRYLHYMFRQMVYLEMIRLLLCWIFIKRSITFVHVQLHFAIYARCSQFHLRWSRWLI